MRIATKAFFKDLEFLVLPDVYEPLEDSFLLAEHVDVRPGSRVLDLGCGCGLVSVLAARQGADVTATDINKSALENVKLNAKKYGVQTKIKTVLSNMFEKVDGKYDYIFFNPPYLPSEEIDKELLKEFGPVVKSWDGGEEGREFINKFLENFLTYLRKEGKAYLLNSSKNKIHKTKKRLDELGVKWKIIGKNNLFFEVLYLFEIQNQVDKI